jgi:hypothetical protein
LSAPKPRWPAPVIFAKKFLITEWQADCLIADLIGAPKPSRPPRDQLLTAAEVALRLRCRPDTVIRELRLARRRQLAVDRRPEAPDEEQDKAA